MAAMKVIGLGHYSRTGKNTLANMIGLELASIAPDMKVRIISFAAKLKDICYQLYAWDGLKDEAFYDTEEGAPFRDVKLPTIGMTPVEIWVAMGTPAIRENVYQNTWIDYALRANNSCDVLIVTDVRFPNEFKSIKDMDGVLIKCIREGVGPRNTVADMALHKWNNWDFVAGPTLPKLREQAKQIAERIAYTDGILPDQDPDERYAILERESGWVAFSPNVIGSAAALARVDFS